GLSYDELAGALGVTGKAVESLLVRARTKLRLVLVRANPLLVPFAVRDQIGRLAGSADEGSTGAVAKLASLPFAAKLAGVGAGVALVAGGSALKGHDPVMRDAPFRATIGVSHALAKAPARATARRPVTVLAASAPAPAGVKPVEHLHRGSVSPQSRPERRGHE